MELMLWNAALTGALALVGWFARTMWAEVQRLNILLNRTREEVARDYVTKTTVHTDMNRESWSSSSGWTRSLIE
jgi:uncharacterized membrane protein YpjA